MRIRGFCLNGDVEYLGGSLVRLEEELAACQALGYDGIELSIDGLDVMIGGRLVPQLVERVRGVIKRFDLIYTIHPPGRLNLALLRCDSIIRKLIAAGNLNIDDLNPEKKE